MWVKMVIVFRRPFWSNYVWSIRYPAISNLCTLWARDAIWWQYQWLSTVLLVTSTGTGTNSTIASALFWLRTIHTRCHLYAGRKVCTHVEGVNSLSLYLSFRLSVHIGQFSNDWFISNLSLECSNCIVFGFNIALLFLLFGCIQSEWFSGSIAADALE